MPEKDNEEPENEILKELAESLKHKRDEEEEKEQTITRDFDDPIQNINTRINPPVLENIAGEQAPNPRFFAPGAQGTFNPETGQSGGDSSSYISSIDQSNEPKYLSSTEQISSNIERVEAISKRDNAFSQQPRSEVTQEAFFRQSSEAGFGQSNWTRERTWETDKSWEMDKRDKDREEVRYEKYDPKLPK